MPSKNLKKSKSVTLHLEQHAFLQAVSYCFMSLCQLNYLTTGFAFESHVGQLLFSRLQNGCDVNSQSYSGNTPLHNACGRGQVDTVRLLLKSGADSSLKNYHNDTPVTVAKNKKVSHGDGLPNDYILIVLPRHLNLEKKLLNTDLVIL